MAMRQIQLRPGADPILDSVDESYGGDAGLALSDLLIAQQSIESFLDELEAESSAELLRQRDRASSEFAARATVSWEQIKLENGL
jgi:predicted polyphosphate/ATP-dependent NAD kinase